MDWNSIMIQERNIEEDQKTLMLCDDTSQSQVVVVVVVVSQFYSVYIKIYYILIA